MYSLSLGMYKGIAGLFWFGLGGLTNWSQREVHESAVTSIID